jgi:hypothetical protein
MLTHMHIYWDTMVLAHGSKGVEVGLEKDEKRAQDLLFMVLRLSTELRTLDQDLVRS